MSHMSNPLARSSQLYARRSVAGPSSGGGRVGAPLATDLQDAVFVAGQALTQAAGKLLRLPQSATAQACVLLARFWLVERVMSCEFSDVSATCLYIVAKMGSHPRAMRDLANVYGFLLSPHGRLFTPVRHSPPPPTAAPAASGAKAENGGGEAAGGGYYVSEGSYGAFAARVLALEGVVLRALGFDTHVALPHALAVTYLQALDFFGLPSSSPAAPPHASPSSPPKASTTTRTALARSAVAHLNGALLSPQLLYATHAPHALAVAAVYCAARECGAKMPEADGEGRGWWEVFDVDREDLGFLVVGMRSVDGWVGALVRGDGEGGGGEVVGGGYGAGVAALFEKGMLTREAVEEELRRREG